MQHSNYSIPFPNLFLASQKHGRPECGFRWL